MTFFIVTLDYQAQVQPFTIVNIELEQGLKVLNRLVANGHQLQSVQIRDQGLHLLELPLEVFTGEDFTDALLKLNQEWQQVLNQPATSN